MRRGALVVVLTGPPVVAVLDGGYGEVPRRAAGVVACLLVAGLAAAGALPRVRAAHVGLAALAALTGLSLLWAPLLAPAHADAERLVLYLAALVAATGALAAGGDGARRVAGPALAAGAWAVVAIGVAERLAPWLVALHRSPSAGGRLDQPMGYWNAMGALAALALTLCAGLAGDERRPARVRVGAAAGAPLLGAAVALSVSRGALLVVAVGLGVLLIARPRHETLRGALVAGEAAAAGAITALALPGVRTFGEGADVQGAALLAVLLVASAGAALAQRHAIAAEGDGRLRSGTLPRARPAIAVVLVLLAAGGAAALAADRGPATGTPGFGADPGRLVSAQSTRYAYWQAALETWADHPLAGRGTSGFRVEWPARRTIAEPALDAHSLPLETAAELGLLGLAALALFAGGLAAAARRAAPEHPAEVAALAAAGAFACIDWAWELPGVTLFALVLGGAVLAAVRPRVARAGAAPRPRGPGRRPAAA